MSLEKWEQLPAVWAGQVYRRQVVSKARLGRGGGGVAVWGSLFTLDNCLRQQLLRADSERHAGLEATCGDVVCSVPDDAHPLVVLVQRRCLYQTGTRGPSGWRDMKPGSFRELKI